MANSVAIRLGVEGQAEVKRALGEVEAAGKQAFDAVAQATDKAGAASDRQMARYKQLAAAAREAEATGKAQSSYAELLGITSAPSGAARASASVFEDAFKSGDKLAAANSNVAKSIGLQAYEWKNLGMQANDAATMLLSGSSAFQVVATQGGQVLQVLQGANGGIGGAFSSIGTRAAALFTPITVAGSAIAAFGITAAVAFKQYSDGQDLLEQSQLGLGRASGATAAGMNDIAAASAGAGRVSVATARDMVAGFSSTGKIGVETFGSLVSASRTYAKITGQDVPDAAQELAKALADPVKGFDLISSKIGGLDGQTLQLIRSFDAQGDSAKAQKTLLDAMAPSLDQAAKKTSTFADAWDALKRMGANALNTMGATVSDIVHGPDASQRTIDNLNRQIQDLQAQSQRPSIFGSGRGRPAQDAIDRLTTQRDAAIIIKDTADREARDQAQEAKATAASAASTSIIDSYIPTMADQLRLEKFASTLQEGLDAGKGQAGADVTLKKVREQLAAGGTEAYNLAKTSRDAFDLSKLQGYAREMEAINQKYRDQIDLASKTGNLGAVGSLVIAKGQDQQAALDQVLRTPSSYRKGLVDVPEQYRSNFAAAAEKYNIDPNLLASVGWQESRFNPNARNKAGAAGIMQFMPETAAGYGINPMDPSQAIDAAAKMLGERLKARNQNVPLALADYNYGAGNVDKKGRDVSRFPKETQDYIASITTQSQSAGAQVSMIDSWRKATEELTKANDNKNQSYGRSPFEIEKARVALDLESQAKAQNREITEGLKKTIDEEATARARSVVAVQQSAADRSIKMSYDALGRTPDEQSVFRSASAYAQQGTAEFDRLSGKFRDLQDLTQTKDLAGGAVKGLVSDLMHGTSAADALKNALGSIGDKLANKAIDSLIAPLFSSGGKSDDSGGIFGSLFKGLGSVIPKFDVGGFTGNYAPHIPVGVVHGGEFVFDAASTSRIGVGTFEAMRRGVRGYADGGYVPPPDGRSIPVSMRLPAMPANANMPAAKANSAPASFTHAPVYQIDARGAQAGVAEQLETRLRAYDAEVNRTFGERYANWRQGA